MRRTSIGVFVALTMILASCGGDAATPEPVDTSLAQSTTSIAEDATTTVTDPTTSMPASTVPADDSTVPTSIAKPEPGDRVSEAVVTGTELNILESEPAQVRLRVSAQLPTPCHEATWEVVDDGSVIAVTLLASIDPDQICTDVIQDAELDIDLGDFPTGSSRVVMLNGDQVAEFDL